MPNEVSFERLNKNKLTLHTRSLRSMLTLECTHSYLKQSRFLKGGTRGTKQKKTKKFLYYKFVKNNLTKNFQKKKKIIHDIFRKWYEASKILMLILMKGVEKESEDKEEKRSGELH